MSLDVWFRDDIRRVLLALEDASRSAQVHTAVASDAPLDSYRAGYTDAIRAVAVAFGIAEPAPRAEILPPLTIGSDRALRPLDAAPAPDRRRP
ncbi:MAG: hypothetical protein HZB53_17515 [Chloroflexi bacterium]|nr:hypothetical protein [Chloroflexota bacterium]